MVLVTDKKYYMEPMLKQKIDLMIYRMTKRQKDNLLLIDGDEGDGKTNMEMGIAYYVAQETKRDFSLKNVFFDLNEMIAFARTTKEQIICWDEGALGGMAQEWWKKNQIEFIRLMMIARKKRHFFIVCIPKFFKLNEYFVVDRSIGLVHVYLRGGIQYGRFVYFSETKKERLWQDWRRTKYRNYKKYYNFHGSFPEVLGKKWFESIISDYEYNEKKDEAIMNSGKAAEKQDKRIIYPLTFIKNAKLKGIKLLNSELAELFGVSVPTIERWNSDVRDLQAKETGIPLPSPFTKQVYTNMGMQKLPSNARNLLAENNDARHI